jgi:DNA-binding response OmpR family regulator
VLVIDDEPAIVRFVRASLSMDGFEVLTASNGPDGIQLARTYKPDVIVLDIFMSPMDGFETLRRIRAFSPVPVVVISATRAAFDRARDCGATDSMPKPFRPEDLTRKIRTALDAQVAA